MSAEGEDAASSRASSRWRRAGGAVRAQVAVAKVLASVPHGIDGDTYFTRIPGEVRAGVPLLHEVGHTVCRAVLRLVVQHMLQGTLPTDEQFSAFQQGLDVEPPKVGTIYTCLLAMVRTAVRNRSKVSVVQRDLLEMQVPEEVARDVVSALRGKRLDMEAAALRSRLRFPRMQRLRWRVDVTISTSALSHVMRPSVLMEMTLDDNTVHTFELSVEQFHRLRYDVAKVLHDMQALDRHPVMLLTFDMDKRHFDESQK